ncbi:MAG: LytR/AlgR family response regulator transcription factor [Armatimonadota bacterium]
MRAMVVDDEPVARQYLSRILEGMPDLDLVGEAADADDAINKAAELKPDVIFLDIRLPGMSGIEVAHAINQLPSPPWIVFCTGYGEYALDAFDAAAIDYVLKPYDEERIAKSLERIRGIRRAGAEEPERSRVQGAIDGLLAKFTKLPIRIEDTIKLIAPSDILFVQARGKKVFIHDAKGHEYPVPYTVTQLENRLSEHNFFRANEGCLVNMDRVKEIIYLGERSYELMMSDKDETIIPLSRSRSRVLRELLKHSV